MNNNININTLTEQQRMENAIPLTFDPFYSNSDYNSTRRLKCILLGSILNGYKEFSSIHYNDQINIIKQIENSVSNESIRKSRSYNLRCEWTNQQFIDIYHCVSYNIVTVLDNKESSLFKKIMDNEINLTKIATLTGKELMPEKYTDITNLISRRVNTTAGVKYTEMYQCEKCKRSKTTTERIQNRSNDESSSFHITCLFCGTKWFL